MACATAKKDGSSRYANSIRARSTRLAGSVRERAIAPNSAKSFSPIANSIACRHAVMSSTLSANQSRKPRTHVGNCESSKRRTLQRSLAPTLPTVGGDQHFGDASVARIGDACDFHVSGRLGPDSRRRAGDERLDLLHEIEL